MRAFEMPVDDLRLVRLTHVDPLLPAHPYILYEFTIPQLTNRTVEVLRRGRGANQPIYTGHTRGTGENESLEDLYEELMAAARLVSGVYSHFLDPLRFAGSRLQSTERDEIFNSFARALAGSRVLPSVEIVAVNLPTLRSLDRYQDELGTDVARWMQYLAFEALETNVTRRGFTIGSELDRLRAALRLIKDSPTILDRYKALSRVSEFPGV